MYYATAYSVDCKKDYKIHFTLLKHIKNIYPILQISNSTSHT